MLFAMAKVTHALTDREVNLAAKTEADWQRKKEANWRKEEPEGKMVGAKGFEPSTSWSRTKNNCVDSVSLN